MALPDGGMAYGAPNDTPSDVGTQLVVDYYQKKALIELKKEQFFSQLADTIAMPKNMGKTIKQYHYMPLLDDANINDQGLDAAGATTTMESTIIVYPPDGAGIVKGADGYQTTTPLYFVGQHATVEATALALAKTRVCEWAAVKFVAITAALADGTDDDVDYARYSPFSV